MPAHVQRHIIAIGGGGFSARPNNPSLNEYILAQARVRRPRVCYIPTASGDPQERIDEFMTTFGRHAARPSSLSLFRPPGPDVARVIERQDVLYVGGGNTRNMLILWKAWGLDTAIARAYRRGAVLAGPSAGGLCWFASGLTDSFGPRYAPLRCLGWLRGSFCPHFDTEPRRRPIYRSLVARGTLPAGYAVDDHAALHFIDERLARVVVARKTARAYRVRSQRGRARVVALPAVFLGRSRAR